MLMQPHSAFTIIPKPTANYIKDVMQPSYGATIWYAALNSEYGTRLWRAAMECYNGAELWKDTREPKDGRKIYSGAFP